MSEHEFTLGEHLAELRRRLLISVLALLVATAVSFAFWRQLMGFLLHPARDLHNGSGAQLIFIEVTELFTTSFKVCLLAGFVLAFPVILYQVIMFVAPGLTSKEKRYVFTFLPGAMLLFVSGAAFGYFVLIPPALHFLLTFGAGIATPMIRVSNMVDLIVRLLFWMGVVFETPLVMYLLAQLGIVSARAFSRFRPYWIVTSFILGALITPTPDPLNQSLVALPLMALYEVGILLARLAGRGHKRSMEVMSPVSGGD